MTSVGGEERVEVVEKRHNHAANVSHSACPACLEDGARRKKGLGDLQMWLQMRDGRIPVTIGNAISTLRFWTWKLGGGRL